MQTYIVNNLAVKAEQMSEKFQLNTEEGTFDGNEGDYIIYENGTRKGCPKLVFEQNFSIAEEESIKKKQAQLSAIQGYIEMGKINLALANESFHLEEEAAELTSEYWDSVASGYVDLLKHN